MPAGRSSIEIARTPQEVFDYVTDGSKLHTWQNAEEVTQLTPGPMGPGTQLREIHRGPFGRRIVELTEIVTFDPGRRFEIRVVEGPPVDGRWDFEPCPTGTRLHFTAMPRLPKPLRRLEPAAAAATRLVFRRYHRRLKRALEAG